MLGLGNSLSRGGVLSGLTNNYSLEFDGSNDYVACGDGSGLGFSGADAFSISAWINPDVVNANQVVTAFGSDTGSSYEGKRVAMFLASNAKPTLAFWGNDVVSTGTISAGQWVHLAMTFAGGNRTSANSKIYIDGVSQTLSGGTAAALDLSDMDFHHIGADQTPDQEFNGNIDEVSIWNKELSAGDISAIYQAKGTANLNDDGNSANLQGWWRMGDGDTFPTITDNSTNSNDGTMTNMASDDIVKDTP